MKVRVIIAAILTIFSFSSYAVTECVVEINDLYAGDESNIIWVTFKGGGSAHIDPANPSYKNMVSFLLAAKMADKKIKIRFQESNLTCNQRHRNDVRGLWIL